VQAGDDKTKTSNPRLFDTKAYVDLDPDHGSLRIVMTTAASKTDVTMVAGLFHGTE
jgi:hypothetical protein